MCREEAEARGAATEVLKWDKQQCKNLPLVPMHGFGLHSAASDKACSSPWCRDLSCG